MDKIQYGATTKPVVAMTKEEFFALAEKRIRDNAGSGFAEWGKHYDDGSVFQSVNQGVWLGANDANNVFMGLTTSGASSSDAVSRTSNAILNINGAQHTLSGVNATLPLEDTQNRITLPPAPDGTKTYDSSTGAVVQHADSATAFAAETTTNKVIISRQDYAFIESFHELIDDKDVVYPLGNVQYGASTYEGIALSSALVAQGFSAFGEWDTTTVGFGAQWSTLTDEEKSIFIQDPENNIYNDNGQLVQVRYRVRVIEGLGDEWGYIETLGSTASWYYKWTQQAVIPKGMKITSIDLGANTTGVVRSYAGVLADQQLGLAECLGTGNVPDSALAHNGLCFAIPLCLTQRKNIGAYHPVYNPEGCSLFNNGGSSYLWWQANALALNVSSTLECFTLAQSFTGAIGQQSGRSDGKYYDAIYASDVVSDLRMSSRRVPLAEIRETYKRKAIAGEVRGFDGVPFTYSTVSASSGSGNAISGVGIGLRTTIPSTIYIVNGSSVIKATATSIFSDNQIGLSETILRDGYIVSTLEQTHKQANPTWTDIIGDPANIAATFPNGVEGMWIPVIPTGSPLDFPLNRKALDASSNRESTTDNGVTWSSGSRVVNTTTNAISGYAIGVAEVELDHYETQAHFTEDDVNSVVLDLGAVWGGNFYLTVYGCLLSSSLIGKILTSDQSASNSISQYKPLLGREMDSANKFSSNRGGNTHSQIDLAFNNDTPAVKTLDYLSSENGQAKFCLVYKEMVYDADADDGNTFTEVIGEDTQSSLNVGELYFVNVPAIQGFYRNVLTITGARLDDTRWGRDTNGNIRWSNGEIAMEVWNGTGWGDNNQFEITDNQSTLTDDNGNACLYGTASFTTQFFIDESAG